ncbi:hypothetical protein ACTFIW_003874 [Dictyostelium discoideum]
MVVFTCIADDKALSGVYIKSNVIHSKFQFTLITKLPISQTIDREFLSIIDSLKKSQHLLIVKKPNNKPFTKRQYNYMKYIKLRHISCKKNVIDKFISGKYYNFQWDESFLNTIKLSKHKEFTNNLYFCLRNLFKIHFRINNHSLILGCIALDIIFLLKYCNELGTSQPNLISIIKNNLQVLILKELLVV